MNTTETAEGKVLSAIHRGCVAGEESIQVLLPKTSSAAFQQDLRTQAEEYRSIRREAERMMTLLGQVPEPVGAVKKAGMRAGIEMNTLMNTDTSHLAEMMMQGAVMGIISITKAMNAYPDPDRQVLGLAQRLENVETGSLQRLKVYLQ